MGKVDQKLSFDLETPLLEGSNQRPAGSLPANEICSIVFENMAKYTLGGAVLGLVGGAVGGIHPNPNEPSGYSLGDGMVILTGTLAGAGVGLVAGVIATCKEIRARKAAYYTQNT